MPGIFDRLQDQLEVRKREEGISPLEIAELPSNLRKVMRLMLREVVMKYSDITTAVEAMPSGSRLERQELDASLKTLVEQNWLSRYGEGELMSYRVNLRRKSGSKLGADIWGALQDRIATGEEKPEP